MPKKKTVHYLILDRDAEVLPPFPIRVLADTGIEIVLSGIRVPRMNSIIERWGQTCRHGTVYRTLESD